MQYFSFILLSTTLLLACGGPENTPATREAAVTPTFRSTPLSREANLWWARTLADVDGDGILDVVLQDNNGYGGWLGYLRGRTDTAAWEAVVIAETSPNGKPFAAGDLEAGDLDGDGDTDVIGVEHPGEWADAGAEAHLFWYANEAGSWTPHRIGTIPSALKDISVADLDGDGTPEIITVTYAAETLSVFRKGPDQDFELAWSLRIDNLHEGMDVGDVDGDGRPDLAANGYWLPNPGNLDSPWALRSIDASWYNQEEEHWSRNATKVACADVDGDGRAEVFITHSEKPGYPVARYDWEAGNWSQEILLDSLPAAHSLQVADIDQDGALEVLTGVNRNRAIDIAAEEGTPEPEEFPVLILDPGPEAWTARVIQTDGVYNLLAGDLEGDGDIDLVRLTSHNTEDMWLMLNTLR